MRAGIKGVHQHILLSLLFIILPRQIFPTPKRFTFGSFSKWQLSKYGLGAPWKCVSSRFQIGCTEIWALSSSQSDSFVYSSLKSIAPYCFLPVVHFRSLSRRFHGPGLPEPPRKLIPTPLSVRQSLQPVSGPRTSGCSIQQSSQRP